MMAFAGAAGVIVVTDPRLTADDWAVLGVVAERPTDGYAIARLLAADGPVGQVWTLERNEVYNSLKTLIKAGLVSREGTQPGLGPARAVLKVDPTGRRLLRKWLSQPVDHIREVRHLLLLKLVLLDRSRRDRTILIDAQKAKLAPILERLERERNGAEGFDRVLAHWRVTSFQATLHFLDRVRTQQQIT
jgi:DNA-binding PadR family transcriptional regulator